MIKSLFKTITFYVGVLAMFLGGIIFIIMSDLTFHNDSVHMIGTVLLCFGSAILFFFSNNFVEKPVSMYVMKGIGLALAVGLVVYYHLFSVSEFYLSAIDKLKQYGELKAAEYAAGKASVVVALAFAYLGMAGQIANIVLTAVFKDDDDKPARKNEAAEGGEAPEEQREEPQAETVAADVAEEPAESK